MRGRMMLMALWMLALSASVLGSPEKAAGTWDGEVKIPGPALRVVVHLKAGAGGLSGKIDIPQQGASDLPLDNVAIDSGKIGFRIAGVPGAPTFDGTLAEDTISGTFTQAGQRFPFELRRRAGAETPASARRPQDPAPPFPYTIEDVQIESGAITLAGTLTMPNGEGPFPAVALLSGTGPQNRDSEIFDHRPFHVFADHLTRSGIAVLRFDDRGVGGSGGDHGAALKSDFVNDALACVRWLRAREDVGKVGLLGHSEGAEIAAAAAAKNGDVAFIIMLAGPGVAGHEMLIEQNRLVALSTGLDEEQAAEVARRARRLFDAALAGAPVTEIEPLLVSLAESQTGGPLAPGAEADLRKQVGALLSERFLELLRHDPRDDLKRVRVPVLAINGSKDVQVSASQNLPAIEKAIKEGGNQDVTTRELEGLNHMLQPAESGGVHEYGGIEQTIDPQALDAVRAWIVERFVKD